MSKPYDVLRRQAAATPDAAFLHVPAAAEGTAGAIDLTYGQALAGIDRLAAVYRVRGYGPGRRVALLLGNGPAFFRHWLALNAVGASVVPLNPDFRAAELGYILGHSSAVLAVTRPERQAELAAITTARDLPAAVVVDGREFQPPPIAPAAGADGPAAECALLYTSGTTGRPKGCILSNEYFLAMGRWYRDQGGLCALRPGRDRLLTPLPMFHMNAMACSTMAMMTTGGCIVPLERFRPSTWWWDVAASGATIIHYLGVMPALLLQRPSETAERAHRVRFGFGANADPKHHAAFERRFCFPLIEAWAMTETGAGACIAASHEPRHVGSRCFGRPGPAVELRLVDDAGAEVAPGQPGEMLVRAAGDDPRRGFCSGYLGDPEATAAAWAGGWFHTGDIARRGPDGSLHFVDRRRNIIRRSGENIAALEVEGPLLEHPAVAEVAVIAVLDELRGEEVMACVVPVAGAARDAAGALALQAWCLDRLAYFKAPGWVLFLDRLPTTATQKVEKARLRTLGDDPRRHPAAFDLRRSKRRPAAAEAAR